MNQFQRHFSKLNQKQVSPSNLQSSMVEVSFPMKLPNKFASLCRVWRSPGLQETFPATLGFTGLREKKVYMSQSQTTKPV